MADRNFSRQRQCIADYLAQTEEHPTAEMVYCHVREQFPNISLGTVYRNLNLLVEDGKIVRLSFAGGSERFDSDTKPHQHFICRHCGCVMDLPMESFDHINTLAKAHFDGEIEGHVTYFYGSCNGCLRK